MRHHLTERELIEYQFKLVSDSRMKKAAEHLERCSRCRENLEQLNRKFSSLELLREEITVSDDLVSQVLEQADRPVQARIVSFRKSAWLAGVAAVLVVGLLLLLADNLVERVTKKPEFAKEPTGIEGEIKFEKGADGRRAEVLDESVPAMETYAMAPSKEETRVGKALGGAATSGVTGGVIPEQPPFAPASAIELVTLPRRDNVQLTIYNSADLTLVRERRNLTLKKGWNWLQFMWANTLIDPTSLALEPLEQKDKVTISQLVFPARLRELGRWLIRSETDGRVPFEITYFTSGLAWRAFYMGTLAKDEKTMHLQSYVRVDNNSGEDYENAQTRLLVGTVHILDQIADLARRQYPYDRPGPEGTPGGSVTLEEEALEAPAANVVAFANGFAVGLQLELQPKEIKKEGLSEYFLYTIEGTETIPNTWGKRLLSFEANDISVKSLYKYDEERWGQDTIRFVAFANDEKHNLGQTPIPDGDVRIYSQADDKEYLSYVGGTTVKYIPVNEEVELNLGPARLVTVEPKLMDFKTENYVFDSKRNVSGWDEVCQWQIEITNTRELPIEVEITRGFGTAYWQMKFDNKDASYEKYDVTHARFKLNLGPRSKRVFSYTVRTYQGEREQVLTELTRKGASR